MQGKKTNEHNQEGAFGQKASQVDESAMGGTIHVDQEQLAEKAARLGISLPTSRKAPSGDDFAADSDVYGKLVEKFADCTKHYENKGFSRLAKIKFAILDGGKDLMLVTEKVGDLLFAHPCALRLDAAGTARIYRSDEVVPSKEEMASAYSVASVLGKSKIDDLQKFDRTLVSSDWVSAGNLIKMIAKQYDVAEKNVRIAGLSEIYSAKQLMAAEVNDLALGRQLQVFISNLGGRQGLEGGASAAYASASDYSNAKVFASIYSHADAQQQNDVDLRALPNFAPVQIVTKANRGSEGLNPLATAAQEQLSLVGGYIDLQMIPSNKKADILRSNNVDLNSPAVLNGTMNYRAFFVQTGGYLGQPGRERLNLTEFVGAAFNMVTLSIHNNWRDALYPADMHNGAVDVSYDVGALGYEFPVGIAWEENPSEANTRINTNPTVYSKARHQDLLGWTCLPSLGYATDCMQSGEWSWLYHLLAGHGEGAVARDVVERMLLQAAVNRTDGRILEYYDPEVHGSIILGNSQSTPWGTYTDPQTGQLQDSRRKWNYLSFLSEAGKDASKAEFERKMGEWHLLMENSNRLSGDIRDKLTVDSISAMVDNFVQIDRVIRIFWNPVFLEAGWRAQADVGLRIETDVSKQIQGETFIRGGYAQSADIFTPGAGTLLENSFTQNAPKTYY